VNKLNVIWCLTSLANVALCLLLLFNGYYVRYSWLFFSCVFSVVVDMFSYFALTRDPAHYAILLQATYIACLGLNGLIIWESWWLSNRRVYLPIEFYLGMKLGALLTERGDFLMAAYYMQCGLRVVNLGVICWLIYIFRKEPLYALE
jgi:hypothetical protein